MKAIAFLLIGQSLEVSGEDYHFVPKPGKLAAQIIRDPPAATADRGKLVNENEDSHGLS
jgi:hypothetical protein